MFLRARTFCRGSALLATVAAAVGFVAVPAQAAGRVRVTTAAALEAAVASAGPGTVISLADGTYTVRRGLVLARNGTAARAITITGSRRAVITGGGTSGHYGIYITGDYWHVVGLTVTRADKGIVLDGSRGSVIDRVEVRDVGAEGVHFRASSSDGVLRRSFVHLTGQVKPQFGEGVYVGSASSNWRSKHKGVRFGEKGGTGPDRSDRVRIEGNVVADTPGEGLDVKEGTSGGLVRGNVFTRTGFSGLNSADSWVDVKGNGWTVSGNSGSGRGCTPGSTAPGCVDAFQVHDVLTGWGRDNVFRANRAIGGVSGYVVGVYPLDAPPPAVVGCDNSGGARGPSNLTCVG